MLTPPVLGQPRTERIPQKRERRDLMLAAPVSVLAVDDARLARMQLQADGRQPFRQGIPHHDGLRLAAAVNHRIIAVALERDRRERPGQPHVERVVQIQVRQYW